MSFDDHLQRRRELKKKLQNRERVFGGWVSYPDPAITETFARAGFDFIAIDMEHTTISLDRGEADHHGMPGGGVSCLPRPVSHSNDIIKPLLEAGADGMIVQMVETAAEVARLVDNTKFPPAGRRSYGVNRAHGYGFDFDAYITDWNATVEPHPAGGVDHRVENIDELLGFDEVDGSHDWPL